MEVKLCEKIKNKKDKKVIDNIKESMIQLVHQMNSATRKKNQETLQGMERVIPSNRLN